MRRIVLLACAAKKGPSKTRADKLYTSALFQLSLQYARQLRPDATFILSAKHGLLRLDDQVEPYNMSLNEMSAAQRKAWASRVVDQLKASCDLRRDLFIILAGDRYRRYLLPHLTHYEIPLRGLRIGEQLQYLKRQIRDE